MAKKKELTPKEIKIKELQIQSLSDCVELTAEIQCTKCKHVDGEWNLDDHSAAEEFYAKGWLFKYGNTYCPDCAKKYLKKSIKVNKPKNV